MNIVAVDPQARVLSEGEILALLKEPIPMRLSMVDGHGWPLVMPVWHVFEGRRLSRRSRREFPQGQVLRANPRAYFIVDTGGAHEQTRGVRGRATVRIVDGDIGLAVDISRTGLLKYMGTNSDSYADEMLKWARDGEMSVVELTPLRFGAFSY